MNLGLDDRNHLGTGGFLLLRLTTVHVFIDSYFGGLLSETTTTHILEIILCQASVFDRGEELVRLDISHCVGFKPMCGEQVPPWAKVNNCHV